MRKETSELSKKITGNYAIRSVYDKLIDINVPQPEAQRLAIFNYLKNEKIDFDELKEKYKPKTISREYKYAIYKNMVYEIESVIDIVTSSKGRDSYYLKLKHLKEVHLFSRKKCFETYEEAVKKKDILRGN